MFFLITHLLIGKYYPSLFTQFIIGFSCYVLSFLLIKDIISDDCCDKYKYYALSLVAVDATYLIYRSKSKMDKNDPTEKMSPIDNNTVVENISTTDVKTGSIQSITLSSEINDYKITHELSLSDNDNTMFSTSDDEEEKQQQQKEDSSEKSASVSVEQEPNHIS